MEQRKEKNLISFDNGKCEVDFVTHVIDFVINAIDLQYCFEVEGKSVNTTELLEAHDAQNDDERFSHTVRC